ncbi:MAG: sugar phosphate isomerase/epimerase [Clostridia bacterium]|nr:sugar phosphate isomerase/epimerase [Clostridia bacterium]
MKIGICASPQEAKCVCGMADYIEMNLSYLASLSEEEVKEIKADMDACGITVSATNNLFPGDMRLCGKDVDTDTIFAYIRKAIESAALMGVAFCVFGSGRQRNIPDTEDRMACEKQLTDMIRFMGDCAKPHGITIVLEPLNSAETNVINTAREGAAWVKKIGHPNVMLLVDIFHMVKEKESESVILENIDIIRHMHIAEPEKRLYPRSGDAYDYYALKKLLTEAGYDGGISIEGIPIGEFSESAPESLGFLKSVFA